MSSLLKTPVEGEKINFVGFGYGLDLLCRLLEMMV
jgi:hypothetical protein